ncbi:hypothetical protein BJ973_008832 [Actinoplanes tereljensis]|uniref:Bulb-type lectin domain-containing protein n=1 Tax=Paractinoplanes tereljensis TaxID=571912 RepID=A0A919NGK5_9ACTN|nr:LamG-like jellyroll fold domain-containing protein [Actinoplanes tereljensis]GIF18205.1 hypothetical protein Ate02nite_09350 [Actinoplanes tereljensis]
MRSFFLLVYTTAILVSGALVAPITTGIAAAACTDSAGSETAAVTLAESCDQPVKVSASQTEFSQVVAQPDGSLRFESAAVPQRARHGDGWADIDLKLSPGADGLLRPAVATADVAFSSGGTGPMATLTRAGKTVTLTWPGTLPRPIVAADSATYADVRPGVDLVVRATETGFAHTLVIKSAEAAAAAEVAEVRLTLGGTAQVTENDGVMTASGAGSVLAATEPAVMWDSKTAPATRSKLTGSAAPSAVAPSTERSPGEAAQVAPVELTLTGHDLVLRPDAGLLKNASYPLYVDPIWSIYKGKWAYATDDNSNNTDYATARVGLNPTTGALYRSFFQFGTTANGVSLAQKHIQSARVEMQLNHSWSCTSTVSTMYATAAINATMKASWSAMTLGRYLDTASGHANEAGGCSDIQGNMTMNFTGAAVTGLLDDVAKGSWSAVNIGFTARAADGSGESTQNRWKKFDPKAAILYVDYDSKPTAPTGLKVAGSGCGPSAVTIGTLTPTFAATFQDPDKPNDSLSGAFEWVEVPSGGISTVTDSTPSRLSAPPNKTSVTPGVEAISATVTATKNKTYAFRAKATDKSPYLQTGPWSAWCQFRVDTEVPQVKASVVTYPAGPGQKGVIRIESPSSDVTKFQYGWDAATKVVAAQGTTPKYADVEVTAQTFGTNVLQYKAIDVTLNEGYGVLSFQVGRPSPPIAKWGLETYPGIGQDAALADGSPALTASNISWEPDVRLVGGETATFNGASSQATTASAVVDTTASFSVSAWVWLGASPTADVSFATQDGTGAAGFEIGVRRNGSTPYWSFGMKNDATQSSGLVTAVSPQAADVKRWTQVAGSYDATEKQLRLFVNGTLVAQVDRTAVAWPATGRFAVGRGFGSGVGSGFWNGSIADVKVFSRVLVPLDFTGQLASDPASGGFDEPGINTPIAVGDWDFQGAVPCYVADLRYSCEAPDSTTAWGRWLALTRGSAVGAGRTASQQGLWLDNTALPDAENTDSTDEYGRSAVKNGTTAPDDDGRRYTIWNDKAVLRTDQSFTVSAWVTLDADHKDAGTRTIIAQRGAHQSAFSLEYQPDSGTAVGGNWKFTVAGQDNTDTPGKAVITGSAAVPGVWTQLTGVYDASRNTMLLLVNGQIVGTRQLSFTPFNASGQVLVGHGFGNDTLGGQWFGGIDDVTVYQGAMSATAVGIGYRQQILEAAGANVLGKNQTLQEAEGLRSSDGSYRLWMQSDGNFVLYHEATPVWWTDTSGRPGSSVVMQADGNLVIYRADGLAIWASNTSGSAVDRLVLLDNGDLVLLGKDGQIVKQLYDSVQNILGVSQSLYPGQDLQSSNGHYRLIMQTDGNFVLYLDKKAVWWTDTSGRPGSSVVMQGDGNLVVYDADRAAVWASDTSGTAADRLVLYDNGDLILLDPAGQIVKQLYDSGQDVLWANRWLHETYGMQAGNGRFKLYMQSDGNFVLYDNGTAIWHTNTPGNPGSSAVMQGDGNLVIYRADGVATWSSKTSGTGADRLILNDSGELYLQDPSGTVVWRR